ncbi:MAG: hypothetical protein RMJ33_11455 [Saprospiraceae bacterium]|nr:hypothetical protein [Saprospiraceae bacterium]MDW8230445.1 hypothetical protein [Saprospiraceae bacterium]
MKNFLMYHQMLLFLFLFSLFSCSSPDLGGADADPQVTVTTLDGLLKTTDSLDRYLVIMMPIWCSASKWLVEEKISSLADSLESNNIPYFFIILGGSYKSINNFAQKNGLTKPYYLISDEWQGNGLLDKFLVGKISRRLKVERKDDGVPFGFYIDKKNRKISYSPYEYKYIHSSMEDYNPNY